MSTQNAEPASSQINGGVSEKAKDGPGPAQPETETAKGTQGSAEMEKSESKPEKKEDDKDKKGKGRGKKEKKEKGAPAGGYDSTPTPRLPPGLTVKFTFHRASNLLAADIHTLSSDPFFRAHLQTDVPTRHAEDPPMVFRSPTVRRDLNPVWDAEWIVANVPETGFKLKIRLYDEDPADHDDRLGNVTILQGHLSQGWEGIKEQRYKTKMRMASKRATVMRGCSAMFSRGVHFTGEMSVSIEVLGRTEGEGGRVYTQGPHYWTKHYSPMIGRLTGTKDPGQDDPSGSKTEKYNFQANQFQLEGPVPADLYHRYVEFKPFIKGMFSKSGIRGRILNKALHHQHSHIYNFDRSTIYGCISQPSPEMTLRFLEMVHFAQGGRLFTYVLTLDSQFRFTETGKEFGIDLLSKHTMHSDVSNYIACSGEFFVRRCHASPSSPSRPSPARRTSSIRPTPTRSSSSRPDAISHPSSSSKEPPQDPAQYELVIDNDSGTYRPNKQFLPQLKEFFETNLPGLHIQALACDDDNLVEMKKAQKENKKNEPARVYMQRSASDAGSSISSSDEEELTARAGGGKKKKQRRAMGGAGGKLEQGLRVVAEPKEAVKGLVHRDKGKEQQHDDSPAHGVEASKH